MGKKRDHDLIAWVVLGALALLLGAVMVGAGTAPIPGLVLLAAGVGVILAAVLRHRRTVVEP